MSNVEELSEKDFKLGFPYDDCRKTAELVLTSAWIVADLNTFFDRLWSLSHLRKVFIRSKEELEKEKFGWKSHRLKDLQSIFRPDNLSLPGYFKIVQSVKSK